MTVVRHQVFEVTIELGTGTFMWNRFIIGEPIKERVLELLDLEIRECVSYGMKVGMIYVVCSHEVVQIGELE